MPPDVLNITAEKPEVRINHDTHKVTGFVGIPQFTPVGWKLQDLKVKRNGKVKIGRASSSVTRSRIGATARTT